MINNRTLAVIKREIKAQIMSKAFIIMTILMPLLWFGFIGMQALFASFEGSGKVNLVIVTESEQISSSLQQELAEKDFVQSGQYKIDYQVKPGSEFDAYHESLKQDLLGDKITGLILLPDSIRYDKEGFYISSNPTNFNVISRIERSVNKVLNDQYFADKNVNSEDLAYARQNVDLEGVRETEEGSQVEGAGNLVLAGIFTMLLYISLLVIGQTLMMAVNEEKNNKVIEILLSSVNSKELMAGKIVGTALTGLTQMLIWVLPMAIISMGSFGLAASLADINLNLDFGKLAYFFLNYVIGLVMYLSLFAAMGSIFENQQDAQSGIWPVMLLVIVPFFMAFTMIRDPANIIAEVFSMVPFTSIMIMPARMTLIDVPIWQFAVAVGANVVTLYFVVLMAAKIYRVGILISGKRPTWPEIYRWLRYDYS